MQTGTKTMPEIIDEQELIETVDYPDTDGLENGDTFIDAATGRVYVLERGTWFVACERIKRETYSSVSRTMPWVIDNLVLAGMKL